MDPLLIVAVGLVVIVASGVLVWWGTHKRAQRRAQAEEELSRLLPEAAAEIAGNLHWDDPNKVKRLALVLIGTYGVREGEKIIESFRLAGCVDYIGGVIAVDLDESRWRDFYDRIPESLQARTIMCESTLLPGGLQGRTIEQVEELKVAQLWKRPARVAVERGALLIRRTEFGEYTPGAGIQQQGYDPAVTLVIASPGGHTAVGLYVTDLIHREFPYSSVYLVTLLSEQGFMRGQFPKGLTRYRTANYVKWFLVTDNRLEREANDRAVSDFFTAIWSNPQTDSGVDSPWNVLNALNPDGFNGVVVPRFWSRLLPVLHTRSRQPRFYTYRDAVTRAVLDGLDEIEKDDAKCIRLSTPRPDVSRYVVVTAPLEPSFLDQTKREVEAHLRERGWFEADPHRKLIWATTSVPMSIETKGTPLTITMVEAAIDGHSELEALAESGRAYQVRTRPARDGRQAADGQRREATVQANGRGENASAAPEPEGGEQPPVTDGRGEANAAD